MSAIADSVVGLPPGPSTSSLVQTYRYVRDPLPLLDECAKRFGDMFTIRMFGTVPWVFVWSPPLLKTMFTAAPDVLHAGEANFTVFGPVAGDSSVLTMDESAHLNRRRLLLPQFHGDRMQVYFDQIRSIAEETAERWPIGSPFAMNQQTQAMTLQTIIRGVFGIPADRGPSTALGAGDAADRELVGTLTDLADNVIGSSLLMARPLQRDWGAWSPWGRVKAIIRRADDAIYRELARRRAAADVESRQDILSLLLQVRDEDGSPLTDREIRDELVVMLMAGHETTGTALAWTFERILSLPEVERHLRDELDTVTGGRPLVAEHLLRLEYLDAVVKETLRSRPIMPAGGARLVRRSIAIGGRTIEPPAILINAMYLLHRRPELYAEPEAFKPERFVGKRTIDPYEFTPFGGGMRRCLGLSFALFEMKAVVATVMSRVRLRIENPNAAVERRGFFLAPAKGPRVVRVA
jgi:cytochrome P450 family 110